MVISIIGKCDFGSHEKCHYQEAGYPDGYAGPLPQKQLHTITKKLCDKAEIIADYNAVHIQIDSSARREDALTLLKRRPCSIEDIAADLGLHRNEVVKCVEELFSEGKIEAKPQNQQLYYKATV